MSTTALQRVMVRMLYDPAFRERVYAGDAELAGLDLPSRAHAWLVRPDRRAWATDAHRRARTLTALLGELPLASAVAASARGTASALDEFFSSKIFHRGIQDGLSLAGMFAAWLEAKVPTPEVAALARLEGAIARASRRLHARPAPARMMLGTHRALAIVPNGTLGLAEAVRASLGEDPVASIVRGTKIPRILALTPGDETILVVAPAAGGRLEALPEGLAALLAGLEDTSKSPAELMAIAAAHGAEGNEGEEILSDLLADGTLTAS